MITLRQFFIVLLALTALVVLVVATYSAYELTPERRARREARQLERRARRVAVSLERLLDEMYFGKPHAEMRREEIEYYIKRQKQLDAELEEIACHCGDMSGVGHHSVRPHKWEECLYHKLSVEVLWQLGGEVVGETCAGGVTPMITLRKFFVVLLALTTLVVAAYAVYEMTPERRAERRARRVAARLKRLLDNSIEKHPEMEVSDKIRSGERVGRLFEELAKAACRCKQPVDGIAQSVAHKEGCLYSELHKEVLAHWVEVEGKRIEERARRALEESRR